MHQEFWKFFRWDNQGRLMTCWQKAGNPSNFSGSVTYFIYVSYSVQNTGSNMSRRWHTITSPGLHFRICHYLINFWNAFTLLHRGQGGSYYVFLEVKVFCFIFINSVVSYLNKTYFLIAEVFITFVHLRQHKWKLIECTF